MIIAICAVGALWFRLQQGPINLDFAKDKIEAAIENAADGYQVDLGQAELIWRNIDQPLLIDAKNVIVKKDDVEALSVEAVTLGLSPIYLMRGEARPTILKIEGPTIQLVKKGDDFSFFWEDEKTGR